MPGLANSYLQIMIITVRVDGPAIDIVRRHKGVDHLHEACGSVDFSSNSSLLYGCVRYNFVSIGDARTMSNIDGMVASVVLGVLPCKCKGTREYVRKPPSFPLARVTSGVRECGAT